MSLRYTILSDEHLILVKFRGTCTVTQFIDSASVICSDGQYVRGFDGLIDLSDVAVSISAQDIKELVTFTMSKHKHGHGKWAVLVTTPIATAFMMLFHQGVTEEHPFGLFSSWEGISSFLDRSIDAEQFEKQLDRLT